MSYAYAANESLWLYCCSLATLLVSGLLISRPSASFLCLHVHLHFPSLPQILYAYSKKKFVVPGKNASLTLLDCLCSKTFCKVLDKAAEDLSNLRKSTKASGSDAIELSDEYIECLLSSFSESQKLSTKYLIEHGYSSMKLPYYNSVNFNCIL